jgi:hypothetical protein
MKFGETEIVREEGDVRLLKLVVEAIEKFFV